jgi:hypothetical protein
MNYKIGWSKMGSYKGLLFIKERAVGSKSESPEYFLQRNSRDYHVCHIWKEVSPWKRSEELDKHIGKFVEVQGEEIVGDSHEPGIKETIPSLKYSQIIV